MSFIILSMGSKEGAERAAAARVGVSYQEWVQRRSNGEKWCSKCKSWVPVENFKADRSRSDGLATQCVNCRRRPRKHRSIFSAPSKTAELRATNAVLHAVNSGTLPPVNTLQCTDCDSGAEHYHHYLGYSEAHLLSVVPLCVSCHRKRHTA